MKIIVDTSVWSPALRRHKDAQNPEAEILQKIIRQGENIFLVGIILQEILQGVKKAWNFTKLKEHFDAFPLIEIKREHYVRAAELKNHLRGKGVQASTIDALIAAVSIMNDCYLFTNDRDFYHIAKHSKLKLLRYK